MAIRIIIKIKIFSSFPFSERRCSSKVGNAVVSFVFFVIPVLEACEVFMPSLSFSLIRSNNAPTHFLATSICTFLIWICLDHC